MNDHYRDLFRYDAWANARILGGLQRQSIRHERILTLFGHLIAAHYVWLSRVDQQPVPPYSLWQKWRLEDFEPLLSDIASRWENFIKRQQSFSSDCSYKTTRGVPFTTRLDHILLHVSNHGTYHRGQITMLVRDGGFEPVSTDYVLYDREVHPNQ